ncbi:Bis(5'-nucleosyl)-tetraphosphatase [asymmetrical] [Chlamydiales bacterium SCGC AG-110-M15]|nr:Bis(5'-nucleosyl)-tetraphosphatase [asymmetrical] [Chlamydiales bacterium SCGC AG-110-M15]
MAQKELCYGIIPLRKSNHAWEVFLVQLHAGHWGFPKGHPDKGESPEETAQRELAEETGFTVERLIRDEPISEHYDYVKDATERHKTVSYFIAEVTGDFVKQKAELADGKWVDLKEAEKLVTFDEAKGLCKELCRII